MEAARMSIDRWVDEEDVVRVYDGILLSLKKELNWVICGDMDGPGDCHSEWKTEKSRYCILTLTCVVWKNGTDDLMCKVEIETQT